MGQFSRRVLQCSQEADHGRRTATWALEPLDIASPESVRWLIMIKWTMITSFEAQNLTSLTWLLILRHHLACVPWVQKRSLLATCYDSFIPNNHYWNLHDGTTLMGESLKWSPRIPLPTSSNEVSQLLFQSIWMNLVSRQFGLRDSAIDRIYPSIFLLRLGFLVRSQTSVISL